MSKIDVTRTKRPKSPLGTRKRDLALSALRRSLGVTQEELARRAKMTQSEISRVELRSDCLTSTLQRYAVALGGNLQLSVQIDGRSYPVTLG